MEVSVMRHLPNPFSTYDPRPSYQHWEHRRPFAAIEKDQPSYRPHEYLSEQSAFHYPPSPPTERHTHTSLPPISTLLGQLRESRQEPDGVKVANKGFNSAHIDPRLNAPPTPPSTSQSFEQRHPPPRKAPPPRAPPQQSPYPTPHESRQGSASSYASRPALHHHHRLSSSSSWSNPNSARAPSPQSVPTLEPSSRPPLFAPSSMMPQRAAPEYSPQTPRTPPSASTVSSHVSDHERAWPGVPTAHPQYAPPSTPAYLAHTTPGTQTIHLPPGPAPLSAQAPTTHPDRYVCAQCAKAFSRPSSLRIHVHSHTGEKPFVCPHAGCGKAFSVRSNMKRHQRGCHVDGNLSKDCSEDVDMEDG